MSAPSSIRVYVFVFIALLLLTALTVGAAFVHMGPFNNIVALTIAVTKAVLVLLYFMHLRHSPALTRLTVVGGVFWLMVLISLTMSDVVTRGLLGRLGY